MRADMQTDKQKLHRRHACNLGQLSHICGDVVVPCNRQCDHGQNRVKVKLFHMGKRQRCGSSSECQPKAASVVPAIDSSAPASFCITMVTTHGRTHSKIVKSHTSDPGKARPHILTTSASDPIVPLVHNISAHCKSHLATARKNPRMTRFEVFFSDPSNVMTTS